MAKGSNPALWVNFKANTEHFDRGIERTKAKTKQAASSITSLGQTARKAATMGGLAFATMGASFSLARASAESAGGSFMALGGSLVAALGAGGPVGLAIAGISSAIGLIVGKFSQAEKAAEEARKARAKWFEDERKSAVALEQELRELNDQIIARYRGERFNREQAKIQEEIRKREQERQPLFLEYARVGISSDAGRQVREKIDTLTKSIDGLTAKLEATRKLQEMDDEMAARAKAPRPSLRGSIPGVYDVIGGMGFPSAPFSPPGVGAAATAPVVTIPQKIDKTNEILRKIQQQLGPVWVPGIRGGPARAE